MVKRLRSWRYNILRIKNSKSEFLNTKQIRISKFQDLKLNYLMTEEHRDPIL